MSFPILNPCSRCKTKPMVTVWERSLHPHRGIGRDEPLCAKCYKIRMNIKWGHSVQRKIKRLVQARSEIWYCALCREQITGPRVTIINGNISCSYCRHWLRYHNLEEWGTLRPSYHER